MQDGTFLAQEILLNHLIGETNEAKELENLFFESFRTNAGMHFDSAIDAARPLLSLPLAPGREDQMRALIEKCIKDQGNQKWFETERNRDVLHGTLAFREGDYQRAIQLLEKPVQDLGTNILALDPMYVLAMACDHEGRKVDSNRILKDANTMLESLLETGRLTGLGSANRWDFVAYALSLRSEAETLIYGEQQSHPPIVAYLAEKREAMDVVAELEAKATREARLRHFMAARGLFAEMTNLPALKSGFSQSTRDLAIKTFAIAWALGDKDTHIRILEEMHHGMAPNETSLLFQLGELPWPLPPDLKRRRRQSNERKTVNEEWADPDKRKTISDHYSLALGMCLYREAKDETDEGKALDDYRKSIEVLAAPMKGSQSSWPTGAKTFAAMAHWQLKTPKDQDEARRLLKEADERYFKVIIEPGEGMYPPWFPAGIYSEMIIKEADELIDPGVTNAPHVAALPPEGWN